MNNKRIFFVSPFFLALLVFANPSNAIDSASAEYGTGNGAQMWRLGAQWKWQSRWLQSGNWHMGGYWDAQVGQWSGDGKNTITDLGLTPVFPLWQRDTRALAHAMIDSGLTARLTCVDPRALDRRFAGREFDRALLAELGRYEGELERLRRIIERGDAKALDALFSGARDARDRWLKDT